MKLDLADLHDNHLMCCVKHDDHLAFKELFIRLCPCVEGVLRRTLPPAEVEDGLAEVFLRLWQRRSLFDERKGSVGAWTVTIARNYARDWWRSTRARLGESHQEMRDVASDQPDPAIEVERADWAENARRRRDELLAGLPEYVRVSFELRMDGFTYRQISDQVGKPMGSVAGALHRLQARMAAVLCEETEGSRLGN